MRSLEEIARDSFVKYSLKKHGRKLPWNQLSEDRKAAWMEEVALLLQELLEELEMALRAPEGDMQPKASFEAGVEFGAQRERRVLKSILDSSKVKFKDDLRNFFRKDY